MSTSFGFFTLKPSSGNLFKKNIFKNSTSIGSEVSHLYKFTVQVNMYVQEPVRQHVSKIINETKLTESKIQYEQNRR
jgi:hypothetical protein